MGGKSKRRAVSLIVALCLFGSPAAGIAVASAVADGGDDGTTSDGSEATPETTPTPEPDADEPSDAADPSDESGSGAAEDESDADADDEESEADAADDEGSASDDTGGTPATTAPGDAASTEDPAAPDETGEGSDTGSGGSGSSSGGSDTGSDDSGEDDALADAEDPDAEEPDLGFTADDAAVLDLASTGDEAAGGQDATGDDAVEGAATEPAEEPMITPEDLPTQVQSVPTGQILDLNNDWWNLTYDVVVNAPGATCTALTSIMTGGTLCLLQTSIRQADLVRFANAAASVLDQLDPSLQTIIAMIEPFLDNIVPLIEDKIIDSEFPVAAGPCGAGFWLSGPQLGAFIPSLMPSLIGFVPILDAMPWACVPAFGATGINQTFDLTAHTKEGITDGEVTQVSCLLEVTIPADPTSNLIALIADLLGKELGCLEGGASGVQRGTSTIELGAIGGGNALWVSKSGPESATAGQGLSYTVEVENLASNPAANGVALTDLFDAGLFVGSPTIAQTTGPAFACVGVNCTIATLNPGDSATFTVTGTAAAATGKFFNSAQASATGWATSEWPIEVSLVGTDTTTLSITKTGPATVTPGETVTYTITLQNVGTNDAQYLTVTDVPGSNLTIKSIVAALTADSGIWLCSVDHCDIANLSKLANGNSVTFTVTADVSSSAAGGSTITNTGNAAGLNAPTEASTADSEVEATTTTSTSTSTTAPPTTEPEPVTTGGKAETAGGAQAAAGATSETSTSSLPFTGGDTLFLGILGLALLGLGGVMTRARSVSRRARK